MNEILLTANDLMRGDWVMRIDIENPYPVQIHEILVEGVIVDNQNNHYINLPYSDIESIILTKEILEKNFTIYDLEYFISEYEGHDPKLNDYFSIYYNKYNKICSIWKTEYIEDFSGGKDSKSVCITSIKYVHDLQHFLKFCIIDKKINL